MNDPENFDIRFLWQKGDVIPTQNASYMSVAVGSKAPREEMAVAQRTGAKLAEEFLNSAAKDVLMTAKVSTENAILLERTRRAIKVWVLKRREGGISIFHSNAKDWQCLKFSYVRDIVIYKVYIHVHIYTLYVHVWLFEMHKHFVY